MIVMNSKNRRHLKKKNLQTGFSILANQQGSVLVAIIIAMTVLAGLGASLIDSGNITNINQFGTVDSLKTYYLSEAGHRYSMNYMRSYFNGDISFSTAQTALNNKTFTMADNTGQFKTTLTVDTTPNPDEYTLTVIGILSTGAERTVTYIITQ